MNLRAPFHGLILSTLAGTLFAHPATSDPQTPLDAIATQLIQEFNRDGLPGLTRTEFKRALTTEDNAPWRTELPHFHASSSPSSGDHGGGESTTDTELRFLAAFSIADADGDDALSFIELIDALAHLRADTRVISAMGQQ